MNETSQSLARLAALIAVTASFALLWANDQPNPQLALKGGPRFQPIASQPDPGIPDSAVTGLPPRTRSHRAVAPYPTVATVGPEFRSFTVESEELAISQEQLSQHLDQLPLGISPGDYRIVDSLGGVGWLRVRSSREEPEAQSGTDLYTTSSEAGTVRFLRVQSVKLAQER